MLKSPLNDVNLLEKIKRTCYVQSDVRASWIASYDFKTDIIEYENYATWALQHWMMYTGFLEGIENFSGSIIDVGCGVGYSTAMLADRFPKSRVVGIDMSSESIQFARSYNARENVSYIEGDFFNFNTKTKFDLVFALEILEHIKAVNHFRFIKKLFAILNNSGTCFISTPNALDELDVETGHIGMLNRERAKIFIKKLKFSIIRSFFYNNKLLHTKDLKQFLIDKDMTEYENENSASHFAFILKKPSLITMLFKYLKY